MWRIMGALLFGAATALAVPTIREFPLDPRVVVELPVSRDVTTIVFPGALTAVAGADMLVDNGHDPAEVDQGTEFKFQITHPSGANFILARSFGQDSVGRLTAIFEGSAYVITLRAVASDSVASAIYERNEDSHAVQVDGPPVAVKFSPRIGLSVLDRARAFPVLAHTLPKAVEGVTECVQNRKIVLPDLEITVQTVYRFSKEDALVFLLSIRNTTTEALKIAPSSFAARIGDEKFDQSIANGPRSLAPGETSDAEFAIVGLPDGTRNDLSADNAFTILVDSSRDEASPSPGAVNPLKEVKP